MKRDICEIRKAEDAGCGVQVSALKLSHNGQIEFREDHQKEACPSRGKDKPRREGVRLPGGEA